MPPAMEAGSLNHCTCREVPTDAILNRIFLDVDLLIMTLCFLGLGVCFLSQVRDVFSYYSNNFSVPFSLFSWDPYNVNVSVFDVVLEVSQRRQWHPTPVLLPGKSHGQRSLVGCSPWGC